MPCALSQPAAIGARAQAGPAFECAAEAGLIGIAELESDPSQRPAVLAQMLSSELHSLFVDQIGETLLLVSEPALECSNWNSHSVCASFEPATAHRQGIANILLDPGTGRRRSGAPQFFKMGSKQGVEHSVTCWADTPQSFGRESDRVRS